MKEDIEYLKELNDTINKKIKYFINPALIQQALKNERT